MLAVLAVQAHAQEAPAADAVPAFEQILVAGEYRYARSRRAGVHVSFDHGHTWQARSTGLPHRVVYPFPDPPEFATVTSLAADPANPRRLAATTASAVFVSSNGGMAWQPVATEQVHPHAYFTSVALSPHDPAGMLLGTSFHGVYETTDGGADWHHLTPAIRFLTERNLFYEEVAGLSYDPAAPRAMVVLAGFDGGVFYVSDRFGEERRSGTGLLRYPVPAMATIQIGYAPTGDRWELHAGTVDARWRLTADGTWSPIGAATPLRRGVPLQLPAPASAPVAIEAAPAAEAPPERPPIPAKPGARWRRRPIRPIRRPAPRRPRRRPPIPANAPAPAAEAPPETAPDPGQSGAPAPAAGAPPETAPDPGHRASSAPAAGQSEAPAPDSGQSASPAAADGSSGQSAPASGPSAPAAPAPEASAQTAPGSGQSGQSGQSDTPPPDSGAAKTPGGASGLPRVPPPGAAAARQPDGASPAPQQPAPATAQQPATEPPATEPPTGEQTAASAPATAGQAAAAPEHSPVAQSAESTAADPTAANPPSTDRTSGDQTSEAHAAAGQTPAGQNPAQPTSAGQITAHQAPATQPGAARSLAAQSPGEQPATAQTPTADTAAVQPATAQPGATPPAAPPPGSQPALADGEPGWIPGPGGMRTAAPRGRAALRNGIYVRADRAAAALPEYLELLNRHGLDSLVIDFKTDIGSLSYDSDLPLARAMGAAPGPIELDRLIAEAHAAGIYVIARLVVFKDPTCTTGTTTAWRSGTASSANRGATWCRPAATIPTPRCSANTGSIPLPRKCGSTTSTWRWSWLRAGWTRSSSTTSAFPPTARWSAPAIATGVPASSASMPSSRCWRWRGSASRCRSAPTCSGSTPGIAPATSSARTSTCCPSMPT